MGKHSRSKVRWRRTRQEKYKARLKAMGHKFSPPTRQMANFTEAGASRGALVLAPSKSSIPRWEEGSKGLYWLCQCQPPCKPRRMKTTPRCEHCDCDRPLESMWDT